MFNDYFRARDLKEWLEKLPLEERSKCICVIGGDDQSAYLNISTQDVDQICEFEVSGYDNGYRHSGLVEKGREEREFNLVEVRTEIKEVVVLDYYGYRMTAADILKKLENIDLDLPLFFDGLDLKSTCDIGIGWAIKGEEGSDGPYTDCVRDTLECGVWNWHVEHNKSGMSDVELEAAVDQELPGEGEMAFVIELVDGGCLCNLDIWEP